MLEHRLDADDAVLYLSPTGPLTAEDFQAMAEAVDPLIEKIGRLNGLMITADKFPGWSNFATMTAHLRFVRDHHRNIRRVAIVSDDHVLSVLPKLASHFVAAEVKHFASSARSEAKDWLLAESAD